MCLCVSTEGYLHSQILAELTFWKQRSEPNLSPAMKELNRMLFYSRREPDI